MGCFSFICQTCGRGIRSSSFSGEKCHLFLLKKGKVVQRMSGEYDSYGRVFLDGTKSSPDNPDLRASDEWKDPSPEIPLDEEKVKIIGEAHSIWHKVTDLMHDDEDFSNGIAGFHDHCYNGKEPSIRSEQDPNQGWGDADSGDYLSDTSNDGDYPPLPAKPGYHPLKGLKLTVLKQDLFRVQNSLRSEEAMSEIYKAKDTTDFDYMEMHQNQLKYYTDKIKKIEDEIKKLK